MAQGKTSGVEEKKTASKLLFFNKYLATVFMKTFRNKMLAKKINKRDLRPWWKLGRKYKVIKYEYTLLIYYSFSFKFTFF